MQWLKVRGNEDLKTDGSGGDGGERWLPSPSFSLKTQASSLNTFIEIPEVNS